VSGKSVVRERRKHERIPLAIPVFVRGANSEGREFLEFATALNISAGGALLVSRRYLPELSKVSLEIPSAPFPQIAGLPRAVKRLRARILRIMTHEGHQLWALQFSPPLVQVKAGKR
jgi:PilZ domain